MYVIVCWNDEDRNDLSFVENRKGIRKFKTKDQAIKVASKIDTTYYLVLKMEK